MLNVLRFVFNTRGLALAFFVSLNCSLYSVLFSCAFVLFSEILLFFLIGKFEKTPTALVSVPLLVVLSMLVLSVVTILLGAPIFSDTEETLLFALLLSLLTILPLALSAEANISKLLEYIFDLRSDTDGQRQALTSSIGALTGAWLAAFAIPLDWDRPWQVWPLPCCIGALTGSSLGALWPSLLLPASKLD